MAKERSFESLNASNKNRKGEEVSETVRLGKARRWYDAGVYRSLAIFWANQYGAGFFSKDSG